MSSFYAFLVTISLGGTAIQRRKLGRCGVFVFFLQRSVMIHFKQAEQNKDSRVMTSAYDQLSSVMHVWSHNFKNCPAVILHTVLESRDWAQPPGSVLDYPLGLSNPLLGHHSPTWKKANNWKAHVHTIPWISYTWWNIRVYGWLKENTFHKLSPIHPLPSSIKRSEKSIPSRI